MQKLNLSDRVKVAEFAVQVVQSAKDIVPSTEIGVLLFLEASFKRLVALIEADEVPAR